MGPGRVYWVGYRYSPPRHPVLHHPGYTSPPPSRLAWPDRSVQRSGQLSNMVVGLISVAQLSLSVHFSGFRTITEVYNLVDTGNPNDHKGIPGNK